MGIWPGSVACLHILIYSVVSEVEAVASIEFKLRKIVFVDFQLCFKFSIQYPCRVDGFNFSGR